MFREAGFEEIEHRVLRKTDSSPPAIVTVARAPDRDED
jgi:demethylmenaquinone methyltransferase/2-methoxy-6-polyprenyl-1,4-benzoquinol methylase